MTMLFRFHLAERILATLLLRRSIRRAGREDLGWPFYLFTDSLLRAKSSSLAIGREELPGFLQVQGRRGRSL